MIVFLVAVIVILTVLLWQSDRQTSKAIELAEWWAAEVERLEDAR